MVKQAAVPTVVLLALGLVAGPGPAAADPLGLNFTYEAATGVWLTYGLVEERRDGLPITAPIPEYMANKSYSSQILQFGTGEMSESYAQYNPQEPWRGFGSAQAGTSTLEVGVESRNGAFSSGVAVARAMLKIKNNDEDRTLDTLDFAFAIPAGTLEFVDFSERFVNMREHVHASIDYYLRTPAGPFGGTWDETTGSLFDYFVLMEDDKTVTSSPQATFSKYVLQSSTVVVDIAPYNGKVRLPPIAPFAELTVYYDMYAYVGMPNEALGKAFLGDPTDLSSPPGFGLVVPSDDAGADPSVPEPVGCLLVLAGLAGGAVRWRRPQP